MAMSVEIVSKEMIKPSFPTPHHLRTHKLSFLDQIAPPACVPMLLFYQADSDTDTDTDRPQKSQLLKQSLSDTLTLYYPLAGRINNNVSIDCNDAGAEYVEANVHAQMSQVIEQANVEDLKQFLPIDPCDLKNSMGREVILAVQINFFDCGGMAMSVCISHKIADGLSLVTFLNAWAAKARGDSSIMQPNFDMASHFQPREHLSGFAPSTGITKEKIVTKRFVFDKTMVAVLKKTASAAIGSQVKDPTRVEAVSAYILRHVMDMDKAHKNITHPEKIYAAVHAVNLRSRMSPPQPESSIGNFYTSAIALLASGAEKGYHDLVSHLRRAIKKIDSDYVKDLENGNNYLKFLKRVGEQFSKGEVEFFSFSSWCRFPVYEVDYGWGRPVWASTTTAPFKNLVIFMGTSSGDGIEAWISLLAEDIAVLERSHKLLSLLSIK